MKIKNKPAYITGICTIIAAIITGGLGLIVGKQIQIQQTASQIANVTGSGNNITMNSVDDLISEFNDLSEENEKLKKQNDQYFKDYTSVTEEKDNLSNQLNNTPNVELKNLGLCIDGKDININRNNSYAIINGAQYFSKEFIDNLVDINTTSVTIQDEIMYLGKVVAEKEELFTQRIVDSNDYEVIDNVMDSFGNTHINCGRIGNGGKVCYSLNEKFSLLRFKISIDEESRGGDSNCIISIMADSKPVYTSKPLNKVSTKQLEEIDVKINNCSVLEISCSGDYSVYPIIYDAIVYN